MFRRKDVLNERIETFTANQLEEDAEITNGNRNTLEARTMIMKRL